MIRSLFLTTALIGIAGSAMAQSAHVNGAYAPIQGTVTLGGTGVTPGVSYNGAPAAIATHNAVGQASVGGQYQTYNPAPANVQTITATPGTPQTFTVPAGQNATYNIVVPAAAAPSVSYAAPQQQAQTVYSAEPVRRTGGGAGWQAKGVYVGARAGLVSQRDTDFNLGRRADYPGINVNSEYDEPGYTGSLVAGYGSRNKNGWGYRVEVEGGYQTASVESHRLEGVGTFSGGDALGDAKVLYGFVNAYGDVGLTERLSLTAGGGVGLGYVEYDGYGIAGGANAVLDDSATAFGYHLDAGLSYQLTDKVALEALYRYQQFVDADVRTAEGNEEQLDLESHSILAGVRVGL